MKLFKKKISQITWSKKNRLFRKIFTHIWILQRGRYILVVRLEVLKFLSNPRLWAVSLLKIAECQRSSKARWLNIQGIRQSVFKTSLHYLLAV